MVSIIIPTYNRAHLIGETLDSILHQSHSDWECLIIDDGATDNTKEVVEKYVNNDGRFKYFRRPKHLAKGANACRNFGLDNSSGEYINWFDDDDIMHEKKLELQLDTLNQSNYEFCICQSQLFQSHLDNLLGLKSKSIESKNSFSDYLQMKIVWLTQAPLFKKTFLIENAFRFNEGLKAAQEWELFSKILFKFPDYAVIKSPLVYLRSHQDALSKKVDQEQTRAWHYTLARLSIYKSHSKRMNVSDISYLRGYCVHYFKFFLRHKFYRRSWIIFIKMFLLKADVNFSYQLKMLFCFLSYWCFGKGEFILKKL